MLVALCHAALSALPASSVSIVDNLLCSTVARAVVINCCCSGLFTTIVYNGTLWCAVDALLVGLAHSVSPWVLHGVGVHCVVSMDVETVRIGLILPRQGGC